MMWLLYTPRAELHEFQAGPEAVPGGFAILSHRWQKEQSFKELQALSEECKRTGANPRDRAHWKIRRFCECAESWGHKWAWADMCCIDKSSSSELSEAINSMYRYYSLAEVCYAYLEDVPAKGWSVPVDPSSGTAGPAGTSVHFSPFGRSEWHKRGWTLQELIAPRTVIFLSQEWMTLGAKADHAGLLNQCTGIPESILTLSRRPAHFSIAQRMSWAARRTTTRLEDEAYCLMGIFDVNMPTLYGEGRRAFRRLQEEIMRRSVDPSLFAWGLQSPLDQVSEVSSESTPCPWDHSSSAHLFAESPDDFTHSREVSFDRPQHFDGEKVCEPSFCPLLVVSLILFNLSVAPAWNTCQRRAPEGANIHKHAIWCPRQPPHSSDLRRLIWNATRQGCRFRSRRPRTEEMSERTRCSRGCVPPSPATAASSD